MLGNLNKMYVRLCKKVTEKKNWPFCCICWLFKDSIQCMCKSDASRACPWRLCPLLISLPNHWILELKQWNYIVSFLANKFVFVCDLSSAMKCAIDKQSVSCGMLPMILSIGMSLTVHNLSIDRFACLRFILATM